MDELGPSSPRPVKQSVYADAEYADDSGQEQADEWGPYERAKHLSPHRSRFATAVPIENDYSIELGEEVVDEGDDGATRASKS